MSTVSTRYRDVGDGAGDRRQHHEVQPVQRSGRCVRRTARSQLRTRARYSSQDTNADSDTVSTRYMPATVNHTSKLMNVSAMRLRPSVVRSNTAMTLTTAECLIRLMICAGHRRQHQRHRLGQDHVAVGVAPVRPTASAASHWPRATDWMPARMTSATKAPS